MTRHELHQMLDQIPDSELPQLERILGALVDPLSTILDNAPYDDEPYTAEEQKADEEGLRDLAAGRCRSLEEVIRELDPDLPWPPPGT